MQIRSILYLFCLCSITQISFAQTDINTFVDIHINGTIKPFNSRTSDMSYNIWEPIFHECGYERSSQVMQAAGRQLPKHSQSHFEALAKGGVRISCLSLSPMERQFIIGSNYYNEKNKKATISCLTGIVANQLFLRQKEIDYFTDLINNIQYLKRFEQRPYYIGGFGYYYNLIRTKAEIDSLINDPDRLGIALTVEGGHALGHSIYINEGITSLEEYQALILKNVRRLKGLLPISDNSDEYIQTPILWMSLAKTYENGLGGIANSMSKAQLSVFGKPNDLNDGPSDLGKEVIELLISRDGRRILVDIKHMSLKFRKFYYQTVERASILGEQIPIVCSHCGISGLGWKKNFYKKRDDDSKNNNSYLNHWQQNLSSDDIKRIHGSNGLIGITLDKAVLGGRLALNEIENTVEGTVQRRKACVKLFLANVFTVVDKIDKASAWNIISVGSDFDAMREPLDPYPSAEYLPDLASDIQEFLERPEDIGSLFTAKRIKELMYSYSAAEITEKIMSRNAIEFIRRNLDDRKLPHEIEAEQKAAEAKAAAEKAAKEKAEKEKKAKEAADKSKEAPIKGDEKTNPKKETPKEEKEDPDKKDKDND
jgi:microsomal dipeptidase-like Zn-dependent dipeptidase